MSKAKSAARKVKAGRQQTSEPARRERKKPEPKLLTRPEVAASLGISERTARRMAGDPQCPLGPGKRIKRSLYWAAESVEDARLWRVETGLDVAPAPKRKRSAKPEPAPDAPRTSKPSRKANGKTGEKTSAKPRKRKDAAPETTAERPAPPRSRKPRAAKRPRVAPLSSAPTQSPVAALDLDADTLTALLPLLGVDPNTVAPNKRGALLRRAGDALSRHLGAALEAARREAGLKPEQSWLALNSLNSYEKYALDRSAEIAADLLPSRSSPRVVPLRRA